VAQEAMFCIEMKKVPSPPLPPLVSHWPNQQKGKRQRIHTALVLPSAPPRTDFLSEARLLSGLCCENLLLLSRSLQESFSCSMVAPWPDVLKKERKNSQGECNQLFSVTSERQ